MPLLHSSTMSRRAHRWAPGQLMWVLPLLLLALPFGLATPPATSDRALPTVSEEDRAKEAAIMQQLRHMLQQDMPSWASRMAGWQPEFEVQHCTWHGVTCRDGCVIKLLLVNAVAAQPGNARYAHVPTACSTGNGRISAAAWKAWGRLAELQCLERLHVMWEGCPWPAALPEEWTRAGTFGNLVRLELRVPTAATARLLPDISPGALPALQDLTIDAPNLFSTLPASWGSSLDVLPSLKMLTVQLVVQGGLPEAWGSGFSNLKVMILESRVTGYPSSGEAAGGDSSMPGAPAPAEGRATPASAPLGLPASWAAGFRQLKGMALSGMQLGGAVPDAWVEPSTFPLLTDLRLDGLGLVSTLPARIFEAHPTLRLLSLCDNQLTGALPGQWRNSQAITLLLSSNRLSGPLFPPAWLNGTMPNLRYFVASGNSGLTGTLPASLDWPMLYSMVIDGTSVHGAIPAGWCHARFAESLYNLVIGRTDIDPRPPTCAGKALSGLQIATHPAVPAGISEGGYLPPWQPPLSQGSSRLAVTVGLATALPLCTLIAAGFAGRVYLRSRRRQHLRQALEEQRLLLTEQQWGPSDAEEGRAGQLGAAAPCPPGGHAGHAKPAAVVLVRPAQRDRLASILSSDLGKGSKRLDLVPPDALPNALAHRLSSAPGRHAADAWPRLGSGRNKRRDKVAAPPGSTTSSLELRSLLPAPKSDIMSAVRSWLADSAAAGPPSEELSSKAPSTPAASMAAAQAAAAQWNLPGRPLLIPDRSLEFVLNDRGQLQDLGAGSHSVVLRGVMRPDDQFVAVKVYELESGVDATTVWREVAMLRRCDHPRFVPLLGVALKGRLLLIAMELMDNGSLQALLLDPEARSELRWSARGRQIALDVAEALEQLHAQLHMPHAWLSPGNVLLSADWRASISDLGLAQLLGTSSRPEARARQLYAAPEQRRGRRVGARADVYSAGLVLTALLTQRPLDAPGNWRLPQAPQECPQEVLDVIEECLLEEPRRRPTALQLLTRLRAAPA